MSKKLKITLLCVTVILIGTFYIYSTLKDDVQEIEKVMHSLNQPITNIAHIEFLDDKQAIAFYEGGHQQSLYFGSALFKKNIMGWRLVSSSSGELSHGHKLDWGFSNLESIFSGYTDLIKGKILDSQIEKVIIKTAGGNEFKANIIEYGDNQKLWFLVTDEENLIGSTITGLSSDNKIIEQIIK